jgi:HAD superfamily hydrolase (TIGR01490 family)
VDFKERNDEFYEHYKAGTLDIHDYVRFATEAVRLRGPAEAQAAHDRFMRTVIAPAIRSEALALVRQHQSAGEQLVIVTATNEFITRPIARAFGIDELIAVELERGADGWITGEIAGVPSAREGKVERVAQWLAARGQGWADVEATFYSDSANDLALLEAVDHPVATNPDLRLRAIAGQRGWRILDLFKET